MTGFRKSPGDYAFALFALVALAGVVAAAIALAIGLGMLLGLIGNAVAAM